MVPLREAATPRLRASLRGSVPVLVSVTTLVAGLLALGTVLGTGGTVTPTTAVLAFLGQIPVTLGAGWVGVWLAARLERTGYGTFGLTVDRAWLGRFFAGVAASLLGIGAALAWAEVRGIRDVHLRAPDVAGPDGPLVFAAVLLAFAAYSLAGNVFEEVVFRRIALQNFLDGTVERGHSLGASVAVASVASLALFGLYHVPLRGGFLVAIDAAMVGVTFALAYLLGGDLALPVGVHAGRFPTTLVYGVTIAGFEVEPAVALSRTTLAANLEFKLVEVGLVCVCLLAWSAVVRGEVSVAPAVRPDGDA